MRRHVQHRSEKHVLQPSNIGAKSVFMRLDFESFSNQGSKHFVRAEGDVHGYRSPALIIVMVLHS